MNQVEGQVNTSQVLVNNSTCGHVENNVAGLPTPASGSDDNAVIVISNSSSEEEENEDCSNDLKNVTSDHAFPSPTPGEKKIYKRQPEEQGGQGREQQQQHETESVFPHRHLKVLLVEDDDSTRHVVSALLRNCGYEVTPVASGVRAWEILEGRETSVDLVLTDLMMPRMSGLELLKKISSREASGKRIPVVMMSSVDSMDIVLKCLSEGAVDFLVKPVRKNELKNLWQHFWRMCLSSSGSGSGSQTKPAGNNNSGSYGGMNVGDGSDNGSGTQSSWTKKPVEVQSHEGLAATPHVQDDSLLNHKRGTRDKAIDQASGTPPLKHAVDNDKEKTDLGTHASTSNADGAEPSCKDLLATIRNQVHDRDEDGKASVTDNDSTLELSLKRSRVKGDNDGEGELKGILHHSGGSAFSKYSNNLPPPQLTSAHSSYPWLNGGAPTGERMQTSPTEQAACFGASESLKNPKDEMPHFKLAASSIAAFNDIAAAYAQSLHQLFYHGAPPWPPAAPPDRADHHHHHRHEHAEDEQTVNNSNNNNTNTNNNMNCNNMNNNVGSSNNNNNNNNNNNKVKGTLQHCVSSNVTGKVAEAGHSGSGNGNGSVNGSVSGSNNLSNNMQNGNSNGTQSGTGVAAGNGDSGNNGSSKGNGTGITSAGTGNEAGIAPCPENTRLTRREVALHKFRQKRKERCFEKKVRYQSRKRLAEQRPRVRGQFVKQAAFTGAADQTGDPQGDEEGAADMERGFEAEEIGADCVL